MKLILRTRNILSAALILIVFFSPAISFSAQHIIPGECLIHTKPGVPDTEHIILCRNGYAAGYDDEKKIPLWVAYRLTSESVNKKFKRSNRFHEDKDLPEAYRSKLSDYRGSGYDRGHMAASATVDFSQISMEESFLMSNITPQLPGFNRHGWKNLESYVRNLANKRGEIYVVTGALFEGPHKIIGNGVHVPTHFYKVIYDPEALDAIAFLVPHKKISKSDLKGFIVSVDEVEMRSGLDFISTLNDDLENDIEDDVEIMW